MSNQENDLLKRLLATFKVEAEEHLRATSTGLMELEAGPVSTRREEIIEVIFRAAHSLKGAARVVNRIDFERLRQAVESVLASLKRREAMLTPPLFDILHRVLDQLGASLARELERTLKTPSPPSQPPTSTPDPITTDSESEALPHAKGVQPTTETVRIPISKLDSLLRQSEELLGAKLAGARRVAEIQALDDEFTALLNRMARHRSDAVAPFTPLSARLTDLARAERRDQRSVSGMVDTLLEDMKQVLMLPF